MKGIAKRLATALLTLCLLGLTLGSPALAGDAPPAYAASVPPQEMGMEENMEDNDDTDWGWIGLLGLLGLAGLRGRKGNDTHRPRT